MDWIEGGVLTVVFVLAGIGWYKALMGKLF